MAETALAEVQQTTAVVPLQTKLTPAAQARGITPESWHVMKAVLFKGASDEMVCTMVDYCKARNLDPLKKPFHIVQVWDAEARKKVDTIWPSIGETRITAMRTGEYAGLSDIKHGETRKQKFGNVEVCYPEWAQCAVYRVVNGEPREFVGPRVYWLETYAQKGKDPTPNSMWARRPFGQLDKCAEAAALRAAFPEENSGPTAEEMEGQVINGEVREVNPIDNKDGNAHLDKFAGQTSDTPSVIDVEASTVTNDASSPKPKGEKAPNQPKPEGVTLWVSADERARPMKDIPAAVFVLRRLVKEAATPALAKATLDNNLNIVSQLDKRATDAIEAILNRRFEDG